MKKLLFKVFFKFGIIIAVLMAVPYIMMGGGKDLPGFLGGLFSGSSKQQPATPKNITSVVTDKEVSYYQWVDENGQTHFSSTPPVGMQVEKKQLRPNTNVVQAVKVPQDEEDSQSATVFSLGGGKDSKDGKGEDEAYNPYSPEGVQKIIDQAQQAAKMMESRNQELQKINNGNL